MCGITQLIVDVLIILQIINYKNIDTKLYEPVSSQIKPVNEVIGEEISNKEVNG
jgi:hypothetical protein